MASLVEPGPAAFVLLLGLAVTGLPPPPAHPGTITGRQKSARGVVSATFSSGLRVRALSLDLPDERVVIVARLQRADGPAIAAAGALEEVLSKALDRPRTADHGIEAIRQHISTHGIELGASVGTEAIQFRLLSRPSALPACLQLLWHLVGSASLDPGVWAEASAWAAERAKARLWSGPHQLDDATRKLVGLAGDPALPALAAGQKVLEQALRGGQIEVAMVGEMPVESMLEQARAALGGLPARSAQTRRPAAEPTYRGPQQASLTVNGPKSAAIRVGWLGPGGGQLQDHRVLRVAARILTTRLQQELRDQRKLTFNVEADLATLPGSNVSWIGTTFRVAPANTETARGAAQAVFQRFAARGPTPAELREALSALKEDVDRAQTSPEYWARLLVGLDARGWSVGEIERFADPGLAVSASLVQKTAARYIRDPRRFELLGSPAPAPAVEEAAEAARRAQPALRGPH